uniref:Small ribosomal subunit protein uS3c n=1 Tax=Lotharella vacuolata TaxID=74820 RepID=A0A140JZS8_9EUKA|nr:30S ribosomal protein S3 [Lotharella vacuolata]BAU62605.1 30S ribosomal protein S3 [Lotharella vacuolata]
MGQKVNPLVFRVNFTEKYRSNWFVNPSTYQQIILQDYLIRQNIFNFFEKINYLKNKKNLSHFLNVTEITISRKFDQIFISIFIAALSSRIEQEKFDLILSKLQAILLKKLSFLPSNKFTNKLNYLNYPKIVITLKQSSTPNLNAIFIAKCLINELENRVRFRKALKSIMKSIYKQDKANQLLGIKINISGRLNGIEMARSEWIRQGRIPLQTISSTIDYCNETAQTKYGILGVKVWVCKRKNVLNKEVILK